MSDPVVPLGTSRAVSDAELNQNAATVDSEAELRLGDAVDFALTAPGETLVWLDDSPLFPATLDEPWHYADTSSLHGIGGRVHHCAVPYFRRDVAELIAIWCNSSGNDVENATRAEWYGDTLVIVEGPYEHTIGYTPEVIRPDARGRYQISPGWLWTEEESPAAVAAELDDHALAVLRSLAHNSNANSPEEHHARLKYVAIGQNCDDGSLLHVHRAADELYRQRLAGAREPVLCRQCGGTYRGLEGDRPGQVPVRYCAPPTH